MKKLLSIFLSLQFALLILFTFPSPAQAGWDHDMYRREHMDNYRHHSYNLMPFFHTGDSFAFLSLYKLSVDIILSILFILFFSKFILTAFNRMKAHPLKHGYIGFTFLVIFPLISIILLGLIWLGIVSFLAYGLIFLVSMFIAKVFIGWLILQKLEKGYVLDWKAGLAGPLVVYILLFIPILGWIALVILMSMAAGAVLKEVILFVEKHKIGHSSTSKK